MGPTYTLVDEPRPSAITHLAVRPYFPLLALMLGGGWIGWSWFAVNAVALGGSTRTRELVLCAGAVAGTAALWIGLGLLHATHILGDAASPYSLLAIVVWKLGVGYWLYESQSRTASLREYYGGRLANGIGVVIGGALLRSAVLAKVYALGIGLLTVVME